MDNGFFITGTDTDAGKTVVAAAVLSRLLAAGIDAVPAKPMQTGCPRGCGGALEDLDLEVCLRLTALQLNDCDRKDAALYKFEPACSPHLAAEKAGVHIDMTRIVTAVSELRQRHETVLVEGAGGVLVPLDRQTTMLDLMAALGLPVIVAARPGLGTVNHTLLTLRQLRQAELSISGVVFCETRPMTWGDIEHDNWRTVEQFGKTKILGRIPYLPGLGDGSLTPEEFAAAVKDLSLP